MRTAILLIALMVTACETPQSHLSETVPKLQGKPVDNVLQRWGAPSRALKVDGGTIYTYENMEPARGCRIEVHSDARGNLLGIKTFGDEHSCVVWLRALK